MDTISDETYESDVSLSAIFGISYPNQVENTYVLNQVLAKYDKYLIDESGWVSLNLFK